MNQNLDQDSPLDPAAMLALVEREQSGIPRQIARQVPWILFAWGIAWLFGYGMRTGRGIRTNRTAAFTGTVFGIASFAGFVAIYIFAVGLSVNGMDQRLEPIFFPTGMGIMIGITYLFAGAIWRAVPAVVMGGLLLVVALVAPFFGYPNNYLFFAFAGGAVFLGGALSVALYSRGRVR